MTDRREEILIKANHSFNDEKGFPLNQSDVVVLVCKPAAISAMDEYMKECCLELLEYMAKKVSNFWIDDGVAKFRLSGDEDLTKEQLFENFL